MPSVWIVTSGDGSDGDEWCVHGIYSTHDGAAKAQTVFQKPRYRNDGSSYVLSATIEEWILDAPMEFAHDQSPELDGNPYVPLPKGINPEHSPITAAKHNVR